LRQHQCEEIGSPNVAPLVIDPEPVGREEARATHRPCGGAGASANAGSGGGVCSIHDHDLFLGPSNGFEQQVAAVLMASILVANERLAEIMLVISSIELTFELKT